MRLKHTLAAFGAALAPTAVPATAQCSVTGTGAAGASTLPFDLRAIVSTVASLTLSTPATRINVTANDFATGSNTSGGPDLTVAANTAWSVSVHGPANWNGPTGTNKSVGDILISAASTTVIVGTAAAPLVSGSAGPSTSTATSLQTQWAFATDPPGNYQIQLTFTLTAP
jgi:hypothetical protein